MYICLSAIVTSEHSAIIEPQTQRIDFSELYKISANYIF